MTQPAPNPASEIPATVPALIVGAGPVGLTLSLFLSQRGIDHLVVEKHPGVSRHPKARGISSSTMETFRRLGLEAEIRAAALPASHVAFFRGASLADPDAVLTRQPDPIASPTPSPGVICSQDTLEGILLEAARARHPRGAAGLIFGARLTSISPDDGTTQATLLVASGTRTVSTHTLIGCDGADSTVRELTGIGLEGEQGLAHYRSVRFWAPLGELVRGREAASYFLTGPEGGGFLAVDNDRDWILQIPIDRAAPDEDESALVTRIRRAAGVPNLPVTLQHSLVWRMDAAIAESFSRGNVVLAGDAAHQIPPTGGHGMNLGIADAEALAWRISEGEDALAAYAIERRRVARAVLDISLDNSRRAYAMDEHLLLRTALSGEHAFPAATDIPAVRVGARLPHAWLADGDTSTLDLLGAGWTLLSDDLGAALIAHGFPAGGSVLVRPDGVIAEVRDA